MRANPIQIGLSLSLLLLVSGCQKERSNSTPHTATTSSISVKELVIVDEANHPRIILGLAPGKSKVEPQIRMLDSEGNEAVLLQLDEKGEGRLIFSSKTIDAVEAVGSLPLGDTTAPAETIWGLRVIDPGSSKRSIKVVP